LSHEKLSHGKLLVVYNLGNSSVFDREV